MSLQEILKNLNQDINNQVSSLKNDINWKVLKSQKNSSEYKAETEKLNKLSLKFATEIFNRYSHQLDCIEKPDIEYKKHYSIQLNCSNNVCLLYPYEFIVLIKEEVINQVDVKNLFLQSPNINECIYLFKEQIMGIRHKFTQMEVIILKSISQIRKPYKLQDLPPIHLLCERFKLKLPTVRIYIHETLKAKRIFYHYIFLNYFKFNFNLLLLFMYSFEIIL